MKQFITFTFFTLLLVSCNKEHAIDFVDYVPQIVVQGSIENEQYPSVLLSLSGAMDGAKDTQSLLNLAIRSAKVTVYSPTDSDILVLRSNNNVLPPFEYIGTRMKGEIGKTYRLKIEYLDSVITAKTTIPPPASIAYFRFKMLNSADTSGYLHISFANTSTNYYQIATRVLPDETIFTPCLNGNIDPKALGNSNDTISMQINKGPRIYPTQSYHTYFKYPGTVVVKLSTMERSGYDFWTSYQNEIINSQNPFFPAHTSLYSNIQGGIGIWCGYGIEKDTVNLASVVKTN